MAACIIYKVIIKPYKKGGDILKNVNFNIRTSEELKNKFAKKCEDNLQSQSEVIRRLMKEYIKQGMNIFKK